MRKIIVLFLLGVIFIIPSHLKVSAQSTKPVIGTNIGDKAPDIIESGVDGATLKLSDLKGKLVLIDFWAAWCGPCRRENPTLVAAYHKFKNSEFKNGKGFTIFSVSLDKTKDSWVAAIANDKLEWPYHVSDLKFWNAKYASIYGVQGIPLNFLIDADGVIVAKNLRGHLLEEALTKLKK